MLPGLLAPIPQALFMILVKATVSLHMMQFKHTHKTLPTPQAHAYVACSEEIVGQLLEVFRTYCKK